LLIKPCLNERFNGWGICYVDAGFENDKLVQALVVLVCHNILPVCDKIMHIKKYM